MPTKEYTNVKDLIAELKRHADLLNKMFSERNGIVTHQNLLSFTENDPEQLQQIFFSGFITGSEGGPYNLDERLLQFFEQLLDVEEDIHPAFIETFFSRLQDNINYFEKENNARKRESYLNQIRRDIQSIGRTALRHTSRLNEKVKYVYETETNPDIKALKLADIRTRRDEIEHLIRQIQKMLDQRMFFKSSGGAQLQEPIYQLNNSLSNSLKYLIEVQQHILDYINRARKHTLVNEKIVALKRLKDRHELKSKSNIEKVIAACNAMVLNNSRNAGFWLKPESLEGIDMEAVILKVREAKKRKERPEQNLANELDAENLSLQTEEIETLQLENLKNAFESQAVDLFNFTINFDSANSFKKALNEDEKIALFLKLASFYDDDFTFAEQTQIHNNYEYTLIFPKTNS